MPLREEPRAGLAIRLLDKPASIGDWAAWLLARGDSVPAANLCLSLTREGAAQGWLHRAGRWSPLAELHLSGRGMERLVLDEASAFPAMATQRWSRTQSALSSRSWSRLIRLRYALIGVGRNGSLMAESLARLGAERLTLIDPDRIEVHNLDAMNGAFPADIGRYNFEAVAAHRNPSAGSAIRLHSLPATRSR